MSKCPSNSFSYNSTLCACNPGFYSISNEGCNFLNATFKDWQFDSGIDSSLPTFLTTVLPLDSIKRITQSEAVLLTITAAILIAWLLFCISVRFKKIDGGESAWFKIRWGISRLDFSFATSHWLNDQDVVRKRLTELGGAFSVASSILFAGLLSALLYQIITRRSIEVHKVRPVNAPDLLSFSNDMEFNITTISSMTCSQFRGINNLVLGTPGLMDYRVFPISTYANYYCQNTSNGPTISIRCNNCQIPRRSYYISWHFVDLPNNPAMAVGFEFKLTVRDRVNAKHVSLVAGTLQSDSYENDKPKTFRGPDVNIMRIHLFPQVFNHLNNLRLIQPLVHDFVMGSYHSEISGLMNSLQNPRDGLLNTTLDISYLSDYIVEIDKESIMGPVSVLANIGGLYAISTAIFLYLLLQLEARIKKLRTEDSTMRNIKCKRRANHNWDKLRKYVRYTWGSSNMDVKLNNGKHGSFMIDSCCGVAMMPKTKMGYENNPSQFEMMFNSSKNAESSSKDRSLEKKQSV